MLTDTERERFATWLEQDAAGSNGLAKQADRLPPSVGVPLAKRLRTEAAAQLIVAAKLRNTQSMTVTKPEGTTP